MMKYALCVTLCLLSIIFASSSVRLSYSVLSRCLTLNQPCQVPNQAVIESETQHSIGHKPSARDPEITALCRPARCPDRPFHIRGLETSRVHSHSKYSEVLLHMLGHHQSSEQPSAVPKLVRGQCVFLKRNRPRCEVSSLRVFVLGSILHRPPSRESMARKSKKNGFNAHRN
ncbi:hypothetical protein BJX76DRAFT_55439 [Aspergillus varians]